AGADHPVGPRAGLEPPPDVRPQLAGGDVVGAVDHRAVDEGGDDVDLLTRVLRAGAGGRGVDGAGGEGDLGAGAGGVEEGVALGHGDVEGHGRAAAGRQVDVVVEELAPAVDHRRQQARADDALLGRLGDEDVADHAGAGPGGTADGRVVDA